MLNDTEIEGSGSLTVAGVTSAASAMGTDDSVNDEQDGEHKGDAYG
jgi:hypothetical protein